MIVIEGELYSSKNSRMMVFRETGKPLLLKSSACQKHIRTLEYQLKINRWKFLEMAKNEDKPYRLHFRIFRKTRRKCDFINIIQQLQDSMVACGWIEDDDYSNLLPVFEEMQFDAKNPRVEIFFEKK